ncbi:hypothetical protein SAMN05216345_102671 [Cupriavidus sp. YR651]|nr:hypothetical protein SAMN05216345_102671 [Cupriavidus sp. YR651]
MSEQRRDQTREERDRSDRDDDGQGQRRPTAARKGRGAVSNLQGRFERDQREAFDDGWASADEDVVHTVEVAAGADAIESPPARLITQVTTERARSILTRNASPDIPFDVSLNPYRGCEHVM